MVAAERTVDVTSDRKGFRLKNKKLELVRKGATNHAGEANIAEERLDDMLCSSFSLSVLFSLLPHELANLEAACPSLRKELAHGENAKMIWVASAYALLRGRRVLLPMQSFADMSLAQIKSTLINMRYARGLMRGGAVSLSNGVEFNTVASLCDQAATEQNVTDLDSSVRVILGRPSFRVQGLVPLPIFAEEEQGDDEEDYGDDDDDDEDLYFSSEMSFCWPGQGCGGKATVLMASLGLLNSACVLEVSSMIKPLRSPVSLSVDVHLVHPLWPKGLKAEGVKVCVDGSCSGFAIPGLDITNEQTRKALKAPGSLLCVLVVRNFTQDWQSPVQSKNTIVQPQSKTIPLAQSITMNNMNVSFLAYAKCVQ